MPYITLDKREKYTSVLDLIESKRIYGSADLNYLISSIVNIYLKQQQPTGYVVFNAAIGALECAKQELYRRHIASYEDKKIKENGDI